MSLIQCSSECLYQHDGYCELKNAAEITNSIGSQGCLHYIPVKRRSSSLPIKNYANISDNVFKNNKEAAAK